MPINDFDDIDHSVITGSISSTHFKHVIFKRRVRHFSIDKLQTLNSNLSVIPWHTLLSADQSVDECVDVFYSILNEELSLILPLVSVVVRPGDKPGMTKEVRDLLKTAQRLHRQAKRTADSNDIETYKIALRLAKKTWRKTRESYYKRMYNKSTSEGSKSKTFWKFMKANLGQSSSQSVPTLLENGSFCVDDVLKASILNSYFAGQSNLNLLNEPLISPSCEYTGKSNLCSLDVLYDKVKDVLKSLDVSKATGPDGIGNLILKTCAESLCTPLVFIFQKSVDSGCFPMIWKSANIVPIFKKGDKKDKTNYRPVALLSNISKVLERLVYSALYEHCMFNNLLSSRNSGFKKGDGAVNQLIGIQDKMCRAFNAGSEVAMVFLDVAKAFDRVWHRGLLHKLSLFGVGGTLLDWFQSYLSSRSQRVVLSGKSSSTLYTNSGVPQGSILGPLLFLIFINDIEENLVTDLYVFADDCALADQYTCLNEVETRLNRDLDIIANWARRWYVTFNHEKTVLINFSLKKTRSHPRIFFDSVLVSHVDEHRHLGMIFTYNLNWSQHIRSIATRALQKIGVLRRHRCKFSRSQLEKIYLCMIRPTLEYGNVIFDNCSVSNSLYLESIQRRATESLKLERETGWETLSSRRIKAKLCLFFAFCNVKVPAYLEGRIIFAPEPLRLTRSSTGNGRRVLEKTCRLVCFRNSFFPDCAARWNTLPQEMRMMNSVSQFKFYLSRHVSNMTNPSLINDYNCSCYSNVCFGRTGHLITQFRLGLSPLRSDLFKYNITDNPFCPACGVATETLKHYFFECSAYITFRLSLVDDLVRSLNTVKHYLTDLNMHDVDVLLDVITTGAPLRRDNTDLVIVNKLIFRSVSHFINQTKRFQTGVG